MIIKLPLKESKFWLDKKFRTSAMIKFHSLFKKRKNITPVTSICCSKMSYPKSLSSVKIIPCNSTDNLEILKSLVARIIQKLKILYTHFHARLKLAL